MTIFKHNLHSSLQQTFAYAFFLNIYIIWSYIYIIILMNTYSENDNQFFYITIVSISLFIQYLQKLLYI